MRMMSGSWSSCFRDEIHGVLFCSEIEKILLRIVAGPVNHGSMSMVKEPGKRLGEETGALGGENVKRKAVSPFSDLTDKDMLETSERARIRLDMSTSETVAAGLGRSHPATQGDVKAGMEFVGLLDSQQEENVKIRMESASSARAES
jgi:hypothetical protein